MKLPAWIRPADAPDAATAAPANQDAGPNPADVLKDLQAILNDTPVAPPPPPAPACETPERNRDRSLYKAVLASLYDAVIIVDQKGYIIASNARAEKFFGYTEADFWNLPCGDLITGFNPLVLSKISGHVSNGRFTVLNANCRCRSGGGFPGEIAISRIHYLNDGDLLLSIRSLERRKKAEERRELELDAARHTCVGLIMCNREGLVEYVNPPTLRLLGFENDHQMLRRFLGDFCESLKAAGQMLRTPHAGAAWLGRASFRTAREQSRDFTVTAALCPARKDGVERVVISLMPELKSI